MFFQYLGDKPLRVPVPGQQYVFDILPSKNGQKTTNARFYEYIVSSDFSENHLFRHVDGYDIPEVQTPVEAMEGNPEEPVAERPEEVKPKKRVKKEID